MPILSWVSEGLQAILSPISKYGFGKEKDRVTSARSEPTMALFIVSIPFMLVAVAIAVVPLLAMSHAEHRRLEAEVAKERLAEVFRALEPTS
jgi:hypothetical protein